MPSMRARAWVVLDSSMLVAVIALQAWRLTGVPMHEWLAVALIGAIVAHLLLHWPWIESRSRRILAPRGGRTRVNYALNLALFVSMTSAMISGFMISKVVVPLHPTAVEYLKWHAIHETSSRIALAAVGLHLGLNWDLMVAALRNFVRRRAPRSALLRAPLRPLIAPVAIMIVAVMVVAAAVYAVDRVMPRQDVTIIGRDRRPIEHAEPPPDIARLRSDEMAPSKQGIPAFFLQGGVVAASAIIGRKVLRLRLD